MINSYGNGGWSGGSRPSGGYSNGGYSGGWSGGSRPSGGVNRWNSGGMNPPALGIPGRARPAPMPNPIVGGSAQPAPMPNPIVGGSYNTLPMGRMPNQGYTTNPQLGNPPPMTGGPGASYDTGMFRAPNPFQGFLSGGPMAMGNIVGGPGSVQGQMGAPGMVGGQVGGGNPYEGDPNGFGGVPSGYNNPQAMDMGRMMPTPPQLWAGGPYRV